MMKHMMETMTSNNETLTIQMHSDKDDNGIENDNACNRNTQ